MDAAEILPGAVDYLHRLRDRGVKTALGSASKNAPRILDRLGIASLFDVIVDGNSVSKAKPDPEMFLKASHELDTPPAHCVVFEDAEAGIEAAVRAGMGTVGVGDPARLKKADMIKKGFNQLLLL